MTSATVRVTTPTASAATIALVPSSSSFGSPGCGSSRPFASDASGFGLSDILTRMNPRPGILTGLSLRPLVVGSLGLSISVASLVALFSRWNEHVTTNPTHPSPRTIASGAAYSYRSRDSSASPPVAPSPSSPPPSCASKVLRRLARRSVPSSSRGALRRISISASRLSASSASSSIVALSPDEKCVAALGVSDLSNREHAPPRPVQTRTRDKKSRSGDDRRTQPRSVAGG